MDNIMDLKSGNEVILRSGGPKMIITSVYPISTATGTSTIATRKWFQEDNILCESHFPIECLIKIPRETEGV